VVTLAEPQQEVATFAGGCFWCLQPLFQELRGVERVDAGYSGGHTKDPTYEEVCTGKTGHAEAVRVIFNPARITYDDLLHVFFTVHDPTTSNRQGADAGTQYRSVVFFSSLAQKTSAERVIKELEAERIWRGRFVTEVTPAVEFYRAEEYHQDYFRKNPYAGYCRVVIAPKVKKFRTKYADRLKV
jgi:peptide-methionine (S)-S-oxide reductase